MHGFTWEVCMSQRRSRFWFLIFIFSLSFPVLAFADTVPTSPAQASPSLMDALKSPGGQSVIKRGLTGALVGGVASGASGGSAGI